ncbi:hypothetical protein [Streptomyces sp. NPDC058953]|uniref:hypothetical protein n=1 Tax=unclassified Streptomyces TaxID=2593676 RepID=UPI003692DE10
MTDSPRLGAVGHRPDSVKTLTWPPCECGGPKCPDAAPAEDPDQRDSRTMARLRPLVEEANQRAGGRL